MKKNMGSVDKMIRLLVAALLVILVIADVISGTWAIISLILAGIFILTSLLNFCPIYTVLGLNTNKQSIEREAR